MPILFFNVIYIFSGYCEEIWKLPAKNFEKSSLKKKTISIQIFYQVKPAFQLIKMLFGDNSVYFCMTGQHSKHTIRTSFSIILEGYP